MRRWAAAGVLFVAGLAATVVGLHLAGPVMTCRTADLARVCTTRVVGEELVYSGLAMVALALLTAVATLAHEAHQQP